MKITKLLSSTSLIILFLLASFTICPASSSDEIINQSKNLLNQGKDVDVVLINLSMAVSKDPDNAELWFWLGEAQYKKSIYKKAIESFTRALNLKLPPTKHAGTYLNLGGAYYKTGQLDAAIKFSTKSININPTFNSIAYNIRGLAYYYKGEFKNALDDFNKAIAGLPPLNPATMLPEAFIGRAFSSLGLGDTEKAIEFLTEAKEKYGGGPYEQEFSLLYYAIGEKEKAWEIRGGRGVIGVHLADYKSNRGPTIVEIQEDGPAAQAGMLKEDIIIKVNNLPVSSAKEVSQSVAKLNPGESAIVKVLRNGQSLFLMIKAGSLESIPLLATILKYGKKMDQGKHTIVFSPSSDSKPGLDVSGAGDMPLPPKPFTPSIKIDSLVITPKEVGAGKYFEVIVDFIAEDPDNSQTELEITMNYSVSQNGKLLKRFKTKNFTVPNGEYWSITRNPKAAKVKGNYTMTVELELNKIKTTSSTDFSIH